MDRFEDTFHRQAFALVSRLGPQVQGWALRRYFDWWHRRPDPWRLASNAAEREKYVKVLNMVPDRSVRNVLDVGCSEGTFTAMAAERYSEAEVTGIDLSARALVRARRRRRANTHFFAMNLLEDAPPGKFDLVFCSEMLYYVGTPAALHTSATRLRELLTDDGLLVVSHPWPSAGRLHGPLHADPQLTLWSRQVDHAGRQTFEVCVFARVPTAVDQPESHRRTDPTRPVA